MGRPWGSDAAPPPRASPELTCLWSGPPQGTPEIHPVIQDGSACPCQSERVDRTTRAENRYFPILEKNAPIRDLLLASSTGSPGPAAQPG